MLNPEVTGLKTRLMCYGVRSPTSMDKGRTGGAGPAGGRYMLIPGTVTPSTNVPFQGYFTSSSPYEVERVREGYPLGSYILRDKRETLMEVQIVEEVRFLNRRTSTGVPMWKVAALHGTETLGVTVNKGCSYWDDGGQCGFCAIQRETKTHLGKSLARKDPKDVAETILEAEREGFCRHVTLTSGSVEGVDGGASFYAPYLTEIRDNTSIPIHVQVEPPQRLGDLDRLHEAGADTVGIHVETLDEEVRWKVCPGKSRVTRARYFKAWKHALNIFGENQVSTFILIGLGEDKDNTFRGLEDLTSLGVIPYVVPFRPLMGTQLERAKPPKPEVMLEALEYAALLIRRYGLRLDANRAGCVRCGACSPVREVLRYGVS